MEQNSRNEVDVDEVPEKRGEVPILNDWQDILSRLLSRNLSPRFSDKDMVDIALAAELQLNSCGSNMNRCGLVDLLNRARDAALAGAGSSESARIAALGILEFHQAGQPWRGQPSLRSTYPTGAYTCFS